MILQAGFRWFAPPELANPDLRRRARALWLASWPFLGVVILLLGIAVIVEPLTLPRRAVTMAAVTILIAVLHAISRAGRPTLASWLLVLGLTAIVTQRAWITGGIHAPVAGFYVLFIVMAGALLGVRGALVTAAACFVGAVALTMGTAFDWLTPRPGAGSVAGAFVFADLAIGLGMVVSLASARTRRDGLAVETLQMFAHDMRSPLQVVLAQLHSLREDVRGERERDVDDAIGGVTALHRLTNSLLDVGRLEAGRLPVRKSELDLSNLAQSVVKALRVLQPGRNVTVETDGDSACTCDPELTRRILENLVSNAMKHTPHDGRVRVVISSSRETMRFAVHDEGPGVPSAKRAGLFEPYSAEGLLSVTGQETSGLGLAFCRLAADAQGGSLRLEDGNPRGSVFVVSLPR